MVSWNQRFIQQLNLGHQLQFPCRQHGVSNGASQIKAKIQEQHSEVWLQKCIQYMTDCQGFSLAAALILPPKHEEPPALAPVPQYRWLMQVYAQDLRQWIDKWKSNVTALLGSILKDGL